MEAAALDGGEDVAGRHGLAEGLGFGVMSVDEGADSCFELGGGVMNAAAELALRPEGEEAVDLIDPGRPGWREVDVPAGALGEPVTDRLGFVGNVFVHDEVDVEA